MAAADNAERLRASRPASLVQVYTAGLRWETEPMVRTWAPTQDAATALPLHRLPLEFPVDEPPGDHRSLWTALWQAACLLRPAVSPAQWRTRVRRLARIAGALINVEARADALEPREVAQDLRTALDFRMAIKLWDATVCEQSTYEQLDGLVVNIITTWFLVRSKCEYIRGAVATWILVFVILTPRVLGQGFQVWTIPERD